MLGKFSFKAYRRTFPSPHQTSTCLWREREGYIVRMDQGGGRFGYGEVAPIPIFGTETLTAAREFLEAFVQDPSIELPINLPCCCFGVSNSKHSNSAQRRDYSIAGLLPAGHKALELAIEKVAAGYRTLKWKVGILDLLDEQAILYDLFKKTPHTVVFRLDPNGSWSEQELVQWINFLQPYRHRIDFIEQPLAVNKELIMADLVHQSGLAIALDESLNGSQAARWLCEWKGPLVVKAPLMGNLDSLVECLRPRAKQIVFSSVFETGVGLLNTLELADSMPEMNRAIGFDTSIFLDELNITLDNPFLKISDRINISPDYIWKQLPDLS